MVGTEQYELTVMDWMLIGSTLQKILESPWHVPFCLFCLAMIWFMEGWVKVVMQEQGTRLRLSPGISAGAITPLRDAFHSSWSYKHVGSIFKWPLKKKKANKQKNAGILLKGKRTNKRTNITMFVIQIIKVL